MDDSSLVACSCCERRDGGGGIRKSPAVLIHHSKIITTKKQADKDSDAMDKPVPRALLVKCCQRCRRRRRRRSLMLFKKTRKDLVENPRQAGVFGGFPGVAISSQRSRWRGAESGGGREGGKMVIKTQTASAKKESNV